MSRSVAAMAVLLALALPAPGQDSLNCRQVGLWPGTREGEPVAHSVVLDPDRGLAFLAMDSTWDGDDVLHGVYVLDVSDPSQPRMLSAIRFDEVGDLYSVAYKSDRLYVTAEAFALEIWDVADPENPERLGSLNAGYPGWRVTVSGDLAYLAALGAGLRVIDVSDPQNPVEVGHSPAYFACGVAVAGCHAYVTDYDAGLRVIDVSDPASPHEVGSCAPSGMGFWGVAAAGDYAYVADEGYPDPWDSGYVRVIDVSNPAEPVLVASQLTRTSSLAIALSGSLAYVAAAEMGLFVYDITDPANLVEVGYHRKTSWPVYGAGDVAVAGNLAYIASWGLRIVEYLGAGVEEPESAPVARPAFRLRPNPARNSVHLTGNETAELYAPDGRKVAALAPGENDVRQLPRGVYFVRRQDTGESVRLVLVR